MSEEQKIEDKMELSMEIKQGMVKFKYTVGSSTQTSSQPLGTNSFMAFNEILDIAHRAWHQDCKERERERDREWTIKEYKRTARDEV